MSEHLITLESLPSASDFYALYWNRQPFFVQGAIPEADFENLIAAEELAGLALEDEPQSRMVKTAPDYKDWSCHYGPFSEDDFAEIGDENWSLLVQNVEQFHPETSALLRHFTFAPRWLMDDVMVGYSAQGGSVGPHMDSYHVFIVQGQGQRHWKVARHGTTDPVYVDGMDLKLLKGGFDGDEIIMACGDVLYVPPTFAHEGTTLEDALTFSVGFLGPKFSELLSSYGQYLAECEDSDQRYVGEGLDIQSAGFDISPATVGTLQDTLVKQLKGKNFTTWLVEFFTESSHEDFGAYTEREDTLSAAAFKVALEDGASLIKPAYVKFAITGSADGGFVLGFDSQSFTCGSDLMPLVRALMGEQAVDARAFSEHLEFLRELYNHQALEFT